MEAGAEGGGQDAARLELQALQRAVEAGGAADRLPRLEALHERLHAAGQRRSADELLTPLLTVARVFGTHLVSLDIREHSAQTGAAVAELLRAGDAEPDYLALPEPEKLALLTRALRSPPPRWPPAARPPGSRGLRRI